MPVDLDLGQLVRSSKGRDRGCYYLVIEKLDNRRVKLVDGRRRPLSRPKVKNTAHLDWTKQVATDIKESLQSQGLITDEMVRAALAKLDLAGEEGD